MVGPFLNHTMALAWEPASFPDADVDCVVVPMHLDAVRTAKMPDSDRVAGCGVQVVAIDVDGALNRTVTS